MPLGQSQYIIPGRSFTAGYSYGYPLELKAKILGCRFKSEVQQGSIDGMAE